MQSKPKKRLDPRKTPRQERSRDTVAAILAAAARVFAASGYARSTTNHIAQRAGVSIGSLYEYFPSKDAILVALTEQHVDEAEHALAARLIQMRSTELPLDEVVHALVQVMVDLHARDPGLHRVLFEQAPLPPRLLQRVLALETTMAAEVAALLERYGFARDDATVAARMGVEVLESLTHRLVLHEVADARRNDAAALVEEQVREISLLLMSYLERKRFGAASSAADQRSRST